MKITTKQILAALLIVLCLAGGFICSTCRGNHYKEMWQESKANEKALNDRISSKDTCMAIYEATMATLLASNDSLTSSLIKTKKSLGLKDKQIQAMASINSVVEVHDTLMLKDTVFKEPDFQFDTVMKDPWKTISVGLKYPDVVNVGCNVKSKKEIFVTESKETVDPPKKFFICRWFQKKHKVVRVNVEEQNPYIHSDENVFIKVIK